MSDADDGQSGDFFRYPADHLFADIWNGPGLSDRDRRLLPIGMLSATGAANVLGIQVPAAHPNGELGRRGAARDRDLRLPLRRLAHRGPAELDRREDDGQGPAVTQR
ncbi:MAG: carboxymuconolactone decarboxylase family protein [Nocardioides sp.]